MSRRGTSSGGGASSLGYLFGSDATTLARPNNRAPPRQPQSPDDDDSMTMQQQQQHASSAGGRMSRHEHGGEHPGYDTPASGYETPTGYHTPNSGYDTPSRSEYATSGPPSSAMVESHYRPSPMQQHQFHNETRAAGKVVHDGGGMSLDMSDGSMTGHDNFSADGQNSGNFIAGRPSTSVQAAPGGGSSLGYLFGGA